MGATLTYDLYVDDSGTRSLDIAQNQAQGGGPDAFALGGILIASEEATHLIGALIALKEKFGINGYLRSHDIRQKKRKFAWLSKEPEKAKAFYSEINALTERMPCWTTAAVIDRKGYNARYKEKYGKDRWQLCKSAYDILIERAAKIANADKRRLKVFVEETGKREDNLIRAYHASLRINGLQFGAPTSDKYGPLEARDFERIIMKNPAFIKKGTPLGDLADLVLFPMVMAKYKPDYGPYRHLCDCRKLIDHKLKETGPSNCGVKYYCFDDPKYWEAK